MEEKRFRCPICLMKRPTSPLIHGLSLKKRYSKHGLKAHISSHKKGNDKKLVEQWLQEDGNIDSCYVKN